MGFGNTPATKGVRVPPCWHELLGDLGRVLHPSGGLGSSLGSYDLEGSFPRPVSGCIPRFSEAPGRRQLRPRLTPAGGGRVAAPGPPRPRLAARSAWRCAHTVKTGSGGLSPQKGPKRPSQLQVSDEERPLLCFQREPGLQIPLQIEQRSEVVKSLDARPPLPGFKSYLCPFSSV